MERLHGEIQMSEKKPANSQRRRLPVVSECIDCRLLVKNALRDFEYGMVERLHANHEKGLQPAWVRLDPRYTMSLLKEKVAALDKMLTEMSNGDEYHTLEEIEPHAYNIANYAMIVWDFYRVAMSPIDLGLGLEDDK